MTEHTPQFTFVSCPAIPEEESGGGLGQYPLLNALDAGRTLAYGRDFCRTRVAGAQVSALLLPLSADDVTLFQLVDRPGAPWHQLSSAVTALRRHGLRKVEIARLLGRSAADITRLLQVASAHPRLQASLRDRRLTPGHARHIALLPTEQQPVWVEKAIAMSWSVRELASQIRGGGGDAQPGAADKQATATLEAFERSLSESLNTRVSVQWPPAGGGTRKISMDWYGVEDLKGLMARIALGPPLEDAQPLVKRQLVIEVQDASELSSLTDHLVTAQ